MSNSRPIGVFDSGIGGLTVAKGIKDMLPNEHILYFGDTAHLPYGDKSIGSIRRYITEILHFFHDMDCKLVVIACNSASAVFNACREDIPTFDMVVMDVIAPVVDYTVNQFPSGTIGVIGTKRTIHSGIYKQAILAGNPNLKVKELATPLLAPMIEEKFVNRKIHETLIDGYLSLLGQVDALILGCTHYPLIKDEINRYYNQSVPLIDAPEIIAKQVESYLNKHSLFKISNDKADQFFVSDYTDSFEETAQFFFGVEVNLTEKLF